LEVKMDGSVVDYSGTYEEYLRSQSLTGWCALASFHEASVTSIFWMPVWVIKSKLIPF
jgi:hypothetical protein